MIDAIKKYGAYGILIGMVLPWLLNLTVNVFANQKDIAVIYTQEENIKDSLRRIEHKLDRLEKYIIQGE